MGKRLNISQPAVIQTELRPLSESFWIDANGQLEQWYYQNTGVFAPDRLIVPLCLTPMLSLLDLDTKTSYSTTANPATVTFQSVEWKVKEWNGSAWVETTVISVSSGDNYYLSGNNLYVRKNNYDAAHAINIICRANYQDPRDIGTTCWLETTLMLSTNMDATQVYPTIDIKNPAARMFNPLKDDPIYEFDGACDWSALEGQGGVNIAEYKADALGTEEIIQNNEEQIINAAPLLDIKYGDTELAQQQFMNRQVSGGAVSDIGDGVAKISNIKGNTVKIVNIVLNGNFVDTNNWIPTGGTVAASNNLLTMTFSSPNIASRIQQNGTFPDNHKCYFRGAFMPSKNTQARIAFDVGGGEDENIVANSFNEIKKIISTGSGATKLYIYLNRGSAMTTGDTCYVKNVTLLDLTAMGIDNLTTVEQVEAWLASHIGNLDYIPYTEGKLVNYGGFSVKLNQLVKNGNFNGTDSWNVNNGILTTNNNIASVKINGTPTFNYSTRITQILGIINTHKYFIHAEGNCPRTGHLIFDNSGSLSGNTILTISQANTWVKGTWIYTGTSVTNHTFSIYPREITDGYVANDIYYVRNFFVIDLTLMFGAGNEPDLDWCNKYLSRDYYDYCEGIDKNIMEVMETKSVVDGVSQYKTLPMGVKTTGFNLWDEEIIPNTSINGNTGKNYNYTGHWCTKNYIPIFKGVTYFLKSPSYINARWYDANKKYLGYSAIFANREFLQSVAFSDAAYLRFEIEGTAYNNDICINLADASRNGTYEPHWSSFSDMSWITKIGIENFNIWDEEWELGRLQYEDGSYQPLTTMIVSKNFIPIKPNTTYYRVCPYSDSGDNICCAAYYDSNKEYLGANSYGWMGFSGSVEFTTPNGAYYMKFFVNATSYGNDICINESIPAYNGRYRAFGETMQFFPNGLCNVGNVYDEVKVENGKIKGVVRYGCVDLGDLSWSFQTMVDANVFRNNTLSGCKKPSEQNVVSNVLASIYNTVSRTQIIYSDNNKVIAFSADGYILVKDASYTDASVFKNAIKGVPFIYELETPYEFEIDYPTKGQFEWYGVDGSGNEVPIDTLPVYSQAEQPSGYGQGTSRININALYGENIPVILRVKRYPWSASVLPPKIIKSVAWKLPPLEVIVTSNKGSAVRSEHLQTATNFTFSAIVNQQGEVISDEVKQANLVFKWYYVKYGVDGQAATPVLAGTGLTVDISTNTLKNATPEQQGAVKASTNVYCEVFLLGAYHLVDGTYVRTID